MQGALALGGCGSPPSPQLSRPVLVCLKSQGNCCCCLLLAVALALGSLRGQGSILRPGVLMLDKCSTLTLPISLAISGCRNV